MFNATSTAENLGRVKPQPKNPAINCAMLNAPVKIKDEPKNKIEEKISH